MFSIFGFIGEFQFRYYKNCKILIFKKREFSRGIIIYYEISLVERIRENKENGILFREINKFLRERKVCAKSLKSNETFKRVN